MSVHVLSRQKWQLFVDEKGRLEHLNIASFIPFFAGKEIRAESASNWRNAGTESTERHPRLLCFPKERPILIASGNGQTS
jgi:hypothetical protein